MYLILNFRENHQKDNGEKKTMAKDRNTVSADFKEVKDEKNTVMISKGS